MAAVNKVILIGNLGANPELRFTGTGLAVANFSLATNESWTDKQGHKQQRTEWHRVVVWGKLGELCGEYLTKGRQAYVEGRLQTREWTDKEEQRHFITEVVANQVVFLGARNGKDAARDAVPAEQLDVLPPVATGQSAVAEAEVYRAGEWLDEAGAGDDEDGALLAYAEFQAATPGRASW